MPKNSTKKPRDFDAVLGNNTPLTSSLVLGGIEGVRRRFSNTKGNQKASVLGEALKYGDLGIDLLIEVMQQDQELIVRKHAYAILKNLNLYQAREAVENGIVFYKSDYFYQVYESVIAPYNGCHDIKDYLIENLEGNEFYDSQKLISNHLFKHTAVDEANFLHQRKILDIDISKLYYDAFDIYEWCQENNFYHSIYSIPEYKEYYESQEYYDYEEYEYCKLFEMVKNTNDIWLMEKLWKSMELNKLAFVHRRVVKEDVNLHFTLSG